MKRARYDGPFSAVVVDLQDGRYATVERGHLLPTEVDGRPVRAAIRDNLLAQQDWSEVTQEQKKEG